MHKYINILFYVYNDELNINKYILIFGYNINKRQHLDIFINNISQVIYINDDNVFNYMINHLCDVCYSYVKIGILKIPFENITSYQYIQKN